MYSNVATKKLTVTSVVVIIAIIVESNTNVCLCLCEKIQLHSYDTGLL